MGDHVGIPGVVLFSKSTTWTQNITPVQQPTYQPFTHLLSQTRQPQTKMVACNKPSSSSCATKSNSQKAQANFVAASHNAGTATLHNWAWNSKTWVLGIDISSARLVLLQKTSSCLLCNSNTYIIIDWNTWNGVDRVYHDVQDDKIFLSMCLTSCYCLLCGYKQAKIACLSDWIYTLQRDWIGNFCQTVSFHQEAQYR